MVVVKGHISYGVPYVRSSERQVTAELLSFKVGREAEEHILDHLRCGTDAITAVFSTTVDLVAEVSCTRKRQS